MEIPATPRPKKSCTELSWCPQKKPTRRSSKTQRNYKEHLEERKEEAYMHALKFLSLLVIKPKKKSLGKKNGEFPWKWHFFLTAYWETCLYISARGLHSHLGYKWQQSPNKEENKEPHRSVLSSDKGGKPGWNGKKKKDIKSCIKIELCKKNKKIPSSSPQSLLVISSAFFFELAPGVMLRGKIKGGKRIQKQQVCKKIQKRYYSVKEKKVIKNLKSITFDFKIMK